MNAVGKEVRAAGRRLLCSPAAMFVAVLTAGLGMTSTAQHLGLYCAKGSSARHANVVLACARISGGHGANARVNATNTAQNAPATATDSPAAGNSGSEERGQAAMLDKNGDKKPGDGVLRVPLPDFSAPELSRFISPL